MIVEKSMHPDFLSNTYLVADGEGGTGFFVDAGGPVEPLIEAAHEHTVIEAVEPEPSAPPVRRAPRKAKALSTAAAAPEKAAAETAVRKRSPRAVANHKRVRASKARTTRRRKE